MDKCKSQIYTAKKRLKQYEPLNKFESEGISKFIRFMEVYCSNHIEGNEYTKNETKDLIEEDKVSISKSFKDAREVSNLNEALNLCESRCRDITVENMLLLHRVISSNVLDAEDCGVFKRRNTIAVMETCAPKHVPIRIAKLVEWYERQDKSEDNIVKIATEFKYRFLLINPFSDGNGRMSRILFNNMISSYNYLRTYIPDTRRDKYYNALKECNKSNSSKALYEFMYSCIVNTYNEVIEKLEV